VKNPRVSRRFSELRLGGGRQHIAGRVVITVDVDPREKVLDEVNGSLCESDNVAEAPPVQQAEPKPRLQHTPLGAPMSSSSKHERARAAIFAVKSQT